METTKINEKMRPVLPHFLLKKVLGVRNLKDCEMTILKLKVLLEASPPRMSDKYRIARRITVAISQQQQQQRRQQ